MRLVKKALVDSTCLPQDTTDALLIDRMLALEREAAEYAIASVLSHNPSSG
jgi:hypothetical protein